jgi:hypothetical protein
MPGTKLNKKPFYAWFSRKAKASDEAEINEMFEEAEFNLKHNVLQKLAERKKDIEDKEEEGQEEMANDLEDLG